MKIRVHQEILRDMQKYIPDFEKTEHFKDYEPTYGETSPLVIASLRAFYDLHYPVDINAWIRVNEPDENLIYRNGLGRQVCFVRDVLCELLSSNVKEYQKNLPMVIAFHHSKSVKLPVYMINLKKYGIEIILSNNFYSWTISIKSKNPIEFDYMGLINPDNEIPEVYCNGFPKGKAYGSYSKNHKEFTFELSNNYEVYTYFYLLRNYLGITRK